MSPDFWQPKQCQNILRERKKKELGKITQDLKTAESMGDKEAIAFLRQEFDKISKELAKLIK